MERSLFQIESSLINILNQIEESGGELTPELEAALTITEKELQTKSGNYVIAIKIIESEIEAIKQLKSKLDAEVKRRQNQIDRMKAALLTAVGIYGDIQTDNFHKISTRKSESVVIDDENLIPNEYKKFVPSIDKVKIKQAIKLFQKIPGARLVENDNLSIR